MSLSIRTATIILIALLGSVAVAGFLMSNTELVDPIEERLWGEPAATIECDSGHREDPYLNGTVWEDYETCSDSSYCVSGVDYNETYYEECGTDPGPETQALVDSNATLSMKKVAGGDADAPLWLRYYGNAGTFLGATGSAAWGIVKMRKASKKGRGD